MECINACMIFLQVTYLSEISNDLGTRILQEAVKGTTDKEGIPLLWKISQSTLTWPPQPRPSTASWNRWKKYLQTITNPTFHIRPSLGQWTSEAHNQRTWHFLRQDNIISNTINTKRITYTETQSRTRRRKYTRTTGNPSPLHQDNRIPVIPCHFTPDFLICTNIQQEIVQHTHDAKSPMLIFHTKHLNQTLLSQDSPTTSPKMINIIYAINTSSRKQTTISMISLNEVPIAVTYFQIPDNRHHTVLSQHAYGCIIPMLWCKSEIGGTCTQFSVTLQ
jgi:hypothetical protein